MKRDVEYDLVIRWKEHRDRDAMQQLIEANEAMIKSMVMRFRHNHVEFEELMGAAYLGFMLSVDRFDISKGFRINTYAKYWVRAKIIETVLSYKTAGKMGSSASRSAWYMFKINKLEATCLHRKQDDIDRHVIMGLGISTRTLKRYRQGLEQECSYNTTMPDGSIQWIEMMPSEVGTPEDEVVEKQKDAMMKEIADNALACLNERERYIMRRRHMNGRAGLAQIGREIGVCRERVRQIETRAMDKIRQYLQGIGVSGI